MLVDTQAVFFEAGLVLSISKCVIQTNAHTALTPTNVDLGENCFAVSPPWDGFKILGSQFTATGGTKEVEMRIIDAWGKFQQIWRLLRRRHTDLSKRLRLFESCVGCSVLRGCESWSLSGKGGKDYDLQTGPYYGDLLRRGRLPIKITSIGSEVQRVQR